MGPNCNGAPSRSRGRGGARRMAPQDPLEIDGFGSGVSTPSSQGRLALAADVVAAPVTGQAFGERGRVGGCCFCTPRSLCSGERRLRLRYAKLDAVSGSYAFRFTWLTDLPAGALAATHRGGDKNARRLKLSRPWRRDATRSYVPARPPVSVSVPRGVVVYSPAPRPPLLLNASLTKDVTLPATAISPRSVFTFTGTKEKEKCCVCYCIIGSCTYYRHEATPTRSSSSSSSALRFIHTP